MATIPNHLFSPLTQRSVTFPNRIAVSPMCQYSYTEGLSDEWQFVHLGSRAVGGAGIVFTEAAAVSPEGRITLGDLGIWSEAHIGPLARITEFVKSQGSVPAIQLAHAGRKASMSKPWELPLKALPASNGGWQAVGPSTNPFASDYATPQALDRAGMDKVVADFTAATKRPQAFSWPRFTPPTVTCCTSSFRRFPTNAPTNTVAVLKIEFASPSKLSAQSALPSRQICRCGFASP